MKNIDFTKVDITGGFWKKKQREMRDITIHAVYDRFYETGRIDAFKCDWEDGKPNQPHFFWDSDVAKWMESAAYLISEKPDEALETAVESLIDEIEKNQWEDGYFNIYYTVVEKGKRFTDRDYHELYCCGHLLEASIAYYQATGKDRFLNCMKKYVDLVDRIFRVENSAAFTTPGHEELELALMKLYNLTGEEKYLRLAEFFIDKRGATSKDKENGEQNQSHLPVREQTEALGHSVRATYLYSAMADLAYATGDEVLKKACLALFDSIANRKMYITGGIGSISGWEAFGADYYLPNEIAYTETCAAIGLAFFCLRMQLIDPGNSVYADIIERILYNGFLSSYSLDGTEFFYENPLAVPPSDSRTPQIHYPITQRVKVFWCSCCPPNITRFVPSVGNYFYSTDKDTVFVNQFAESEADVETESGETVHISQKTDFPNSGAVEITVDKTCRLAVRIPSWCKKYSGDRGYMYFDCKNGEIISLDFEMKPVWMDANVRVYANAGRSALTYGPKVFCMEAVDNGDYLNCVRIREDEPVEIGFDSELDVPVLFVKARKREDDRNLYSEHKPASVYFTAKFIPFHTFANRGESEMVTWVILD